MKQTAICLLTLLLTLIPSRAAETLPAEISDETYWKMISEFSEPEGQYAFQVVTSNETAYQTVLPELTRSVPAGGAYIGVGPEQNFTYIAALRPRIAFIVDIRRDMMLEHLMYKAVFELSADRVDFVSNLFSRPRPPELTDESSVNVIFRAYAGAKADPALAEENLKRILTRLTGERKFGLSLTDERRIRAIYLLFVREGVINFMSSIESPGYTALMTATDGAGRNWSFLATTENYDRVRAMHRKNLIVPLVGDFAGTRALRMAGQYVRDHGAVVNVFYASNVEDYIEHMWPAFVRNMASLPVTETSTLIRLSLRSGRFQPWLSSIGGFVRTAGIQ